MERSLRRVVTHAPAEDMLDLFTTVQWERLCAAVALPRVERRKSAKILTLSSATCCSGLVRREAGER
jgi:hypothetical protein